MAPGWKLVKMDRNEIVGRPFYSRLLPPIRLTGEFACNNVQELRSLYILSNNASNVKNGKWNSYKLKTFSRLEKGKRFAPIDQKQAIPRTCVSECVCSALISFRIRIAGITLVQTKHDDGIPKRSCFEFSSIFDFFQNFYRNIVNFAGVRMMMDCFTRWSYQNAKPILQHCVSKGKERVVVQLRSKWLSFNLVVITTFKTISDISFGINWLDVGGFSTSSSLYSNHNKVSDHFGKQIWCVV